MEQLRGADSSSTREAIKALARQYDAAYNNGDASALALLYRDDAQILKADEETIKGRNAIERYWKGEIAAGTTTSESATLEVEDHGNVATESGTFVSRKPDGTVEAQGKYFVVWKRDGPTWRIHRETWNVDRPSAASVEREVRRINEEYERAWVRQEAATFERLLSDDFVQVDPDGKVLSRTEVIANAKSGDTKFEVGQSSDVKIRAYGDTAVVTGRWTEKSTTKGETTEAVMQNIVVFAKLKGHWQVVSDQVTVIAPR